MLGTPSPWLLLAWVWGDDIQLARHMQLECASSEQNTAHARNINRIGKPHLCLTSMLEITFVVHGMSGGLIGHGRLNSGKPLSTPHLSTVKERQSERGISILLLPQLGEKWPENTPALNIFPPREREGRICKSLPFFISYTIRC